MNRGVTYSLFAALLAVGALPACRSKVSSKVSSSEQAGAGAGEGEGDGGDTAMAITEFHPLVAGPGAEIQLTGSNLKDSLSVTLEDGQKLAVSVGSDISAAFTLPSKLAFGPFKLTAEQEGTTQEATLFFNGGKEDHPIITEDAKDVCSGKTYYNAAGKLTKGKKDCSSGSTPACTSAGQVGCVTTDDFKASDQDVPDLCTADGQTDCVTSTAFKAADMSHVLAASVATGETIAGVPGTAILESHSDCASDGASGCVVDGTLYLAAKLANFTSGDIRDAVQIAGITGVLVGAPTSCSADAETGCLANSSFVAADVTGLASKVLSSASVAGVTGNVTLPAVGNVFSGIQYGVSGNGRTGTLTLPAAGNVLGTSGAYGVAGNGTTPTLTLPSAGNVLGTSGTYGVAGNGTTPTLTLPAAGKVYTGIQYGVAGTGTTGTLTLPSAGNVLATSATFGDPGAAVTPTLTLPAAGKVYTGIQYGVAGTGSTGTLTLPAAGNVLASSGTFGDPGAAVTPTLTLPAAGKVYTGIQYGIAGTGTTGTLTLPSAGDVLTGSAAFGDPGAAVTPTLTLPPVGSVLTGSGTYGNPGSPVTPTLTLPAAGNVLASAGAYGSAGNGTTPTLTLPAAADVYTGTSYGVGGNGSTGTLTLASAANVRSSNGAFGRGGNSVTPSLADCATDGSLGCVTVTGYPAAKVGTSNLDERNIKNGITIGGVAGLYPSSTYKLPSASAGVSDLTDTNLNSSLQSSSSFEWWSSDGSYYSATGDTALADGNNIKSGLTLFGTPGSLVGASSCTDAGQTGCLTTTTYRSSKIFRNTARSSTATVVFNNTTSPAAAGIDSYDTIEDYQANNSGLPPDQPWGSAGAASSSYWQDLTTDTACDSSGDECVYMDTVTGLMWAEEGVYQDFSAVAAGSWPCGKSGCTQSNGNISSGGGSGAYSAGDALTWWDAIYACNLLSTRNFGGYNTNWRLPTQKELMEAYVHGIRSVASGNFLQTGSSSKISASTRSDILNQALTVNLATGAGASVLKTTASGYMCVR